MKMVMLADARKWAEPCEQFFPALPHFIGSEEQLAETDADVYIVHSEAIDFDRFCDWAETCPAESRTFVIVSGDHFLVRQWERFCLSRGIGIWEESDRFPAAEVIREMARHLPHHMESSLTGGNRTVMFVGTTPNIGTTVAAFATAVNVARRTDRQIAYLCLNLKSSKIHHYLGVDKPAMTLDGMRTELKTTSLTPHRLLQFCHRLSKTPNLHILFGNMYREQAEFYTPEDIRHLLQVASRTFDCCIVDVNAYWDNAATICAALHADLKIAVTSNRLACFQEDLNRHLKASCELLGLSYREFDLLVIDSGTGSYQARDIRKETGLNIIAYMQQYEELDRYVDRGKLEEFFYADAKAKVSKDLLPLARTIQTYFALEEKIQPEPRKMRLRPLRLFHG